MACDCDCSKRKIIIKHDDSLKDIEWLMKDLYEKVGVLHNRVQKLERENDQLIEFVDLMSIELEDLERYVVDLEKEVKQ